MTVYYNEFDKKTADWLRQLIKNGDIAYGVVDDRSIIEVEAKEIKDFKQHHFFAGIGTWSYALRQAGWPDNKNVWTASLPCQPFSIAGNRKGKEDERHLLPHFLELVKQCRPDVIFGEQVQAAIKHGWLDDLYDEMERENYSVGSVVLTAAGAGKAHIRQRLYWVGNTESNEKYTKPERGLYPESSNECDSGIDWIYCRDEKYRPVKSGIKPLVDGTSRGMVLGSNSIITPNDSAEAKTLRLKGYGNAIVAPVAEKFIKAYIEIKNGN